MARTSGVRRRLMTATVVFAAAATAGCVRLPDAGPVHTISERPPALTTGGTEFRPAGPVPGQAAATIVDRFLTAMTATPVRTDIAREFLADDEQATWDPTRRIITYEGRDSSTSGDSVNVKLTGASWVDAQGQWQGRLGNGRRTLSFPMTSQNGQYRIAHAPNALVVPGDWFQFRGYRPANVYYLDPTASILVPEPVFIPQGTQLATLLVQALLAGPGDRLADISRTFVPAGLSAGLSVPVSSTGIATITLQGGDGALTPLAAKLMVYQFAWTLKQDPDITGFRITIDDQPVTLENGGAQFSIELGSEYDPNDVLSSSQLFGVRNGGLDTGTATGMAAAAGPFGSGGYAIDDVAVSLRGTMAAAVADGGTSLLLGPVSQQGTVSRIIPRATDLLRPGWDFADRLWVVDRTPGGAQVTTIDLHPGEGKPVPVVVPGITGKDVRKILVSRDGTRLVAVVHGADADSLRVSRIRHDPAGKVIGATRARPLQWTTGEVHRIRDIAWRSPTTIAVLHALARGVVQVVSSPIDGSPIRDNAFTQRQHALGLVGSPVSNETVFTRTRTALVDPTGLDTQQHPVQPGVVTIHYAG